MKRHIRTFGFALLFIVMIVGAAGCGGCGYTQIEPSTVGVVFDKYSGIQETVLKPGLQWQGWNTEIIMYPTSIHNATYVKNAKEGERQQDDSIVGATIEGAQLPIDVTVVWHVDAGNTVTVFKNFGDDPLEDIQMNFIRYLATFGVNATSGTKSIFDITSKDRAKFGPEVKAIISPYMTEMGLTCDDVTIGETWQSQDITELVKDRIEKSSELQTVTNKLTQAKIDGATLVNNAKATASINEMKANQGSEAIELMKRKLEATLIEKWDGEVPTVGDGGGIPFINPSMLKASPPSSAPTGKGKGQ